MLELFGQAAWQVAVASFVLGAGLPVIFAIGVRATVPADGESGETGATQLPALRRLAGILCFVLVGLAVVLGITVIVAAGFGKAVSFESGVPTIVDAE